MASKVLVTPKGKIGWNHIKEPATFKGSPIGYDVEVILNKQEDEDFLNKLQALLDAEYSKEIEKLKAKKKFGEAKALIVNSPFKIVYNEAGEETDEVILKFQQKVKDLVTPPQFVVVDNKKEKITDLDFIPKNSLIKVAFVPKFWSFGGKSGLSLLLKGIQIIELRDKDYVPEEEVVDVFGTEEGGDPFATETPDPFTDKGDF